MYIAIPVNENVLSESTKIITPTASLPTYSHQFPFLLWPVPLIHMQIKSTQINICTKQIRHLERNDKLRSCATSSSHNEPAESMSEDIAADLDSIIQLFEKVSHFHETRSLFLLCL
jgi:hypothetical protein